MKSAAAPALHVKTLKAHLSSKGISAMHPPDEHAQRQKRRAKIMLERSPFITASRQTLLQIRLRRQPLSLSEGIENLQPA